jgi:DME family drug/metabolite transporter
VYSGETEDLEMMESLSGPALGAASGLGAAVTWALTSLLVRTLNPHLGSVAVNALRTTLAGTLLLAWVLIAQGAAPLVAMSWSSALLLTLSILIALALGDTVFFDSTRRLGLGRGMAIAMTYPLVAAILAATFLGEPLAPRQAAGVLLTLGGLILIVLPRAAEPRGPDGWWRGVGGAVLAALAWGVSSVLLKPPLTEVEPVTAQAFRLPLAGAVLFATPWARGAVRALWAGGPPALWQMAALSVLTAVSSVMFVASLKWASVTVATVLSSTAPMFAIPLGLIFLGERLAMRPAVGAAVTVAGMVVLQS